MQILRMLFPARSLEGVETPTRVKFDATILSENTIVGPINGFRGAVVEVALFAVYDENYREEPWPLHNNRPVEPTQILSRAYTPSVLHLACPGGQLEVPLGTASYRFTQYGYGTPVQRPLPPEFADAMRQLPDAAVPHVRELALSKGERVRVNGVVTREVARTVPHEYRDVSVEYVFRPAGELVIEDRSV